ncbi:MAG: nucleotide exchange factor GrpE, partial [Dehalococcoidia bacterium]
LLPVVDNFERTLSSLAESAAADPVVQGVKLMSEQYTRVLKDHGIEPIEAVGQPFDPTLHEAMMQDRDSDQPAGTVTEKMQRGYQMNDRVLRPARVAVAAGPEEEEGASSSGDQSPKEQEPPSQGGQQRQEPNRADV